MSIDDTRRNRVVDELHDVCRSAIDAGISAQDFKQFVAEAWLQVLDEKRQMDAKTIWEGVR